jgi:hypothetical protein
MSCAFAIKSRFHTAALGRNIAFDASGKKADVHDSYGTRWRKIMLALGRGPGHHVPARAVVSIFCSTDQSK